MKIYICPKCKHRVYANGNPTTIACRVCASRKNIEDCYIVDTFDGGVSNNQLGIYDHGGSDCGYYAVTGRRDKPRSLSDIQMPPYIEWKSCDIVHNTGEAHFYLANGASGYMNFAFPILAFIILWCSLFFHIYWLAIFTPLPIVIAGLLIRASTVCIFVSPDRIGFKQGKGNKGDPVYFLRSKEFTHVTPYYYRMEEFVVCSRDDQKHQFKCQPDEGLISFVHQILGADLGTVD